VGQSVLLPPTAHDLLAPGHSAHFISDLVRQQPEPSAIVENWDETRGHPPYDLRSLSFSGKLEERWR
jgi:hypothetical protein